MKSFEGRHFQIRYETWGEPGHSAHLFFHGFPGSHIQAAPLAPHLENKKIFLISADRPGYGGTKGSGNHLQYLEDLRRLLNHLGVSKFNILAVSGGSPWAHWMASQFAEDVLAMRIACGLVPYAKETEALFKKYQQRGFQLRKTVPTFVAETFINAAIRKFNPQELFPRLLERLSVPDRETLGMPEYKQLILNSIEHARAQGAKGIINDSSLYVRDWLSKDCDIEKLQEIPTVYFHGCEDEILDYRMSEWMHKKNPKAQLKLLEKEGHYSLPLRHAGVIVQS